MAKIKCLSCNTTLESLLEHDKKICECPNQAWIDGGDFFTRVGAVNPELIEIVEE